MSKSSKTNKPNNGGGYDNTTNTLIALHEPPASLVALRNELAFHPEVCEFAIQGDTFEECLGRIATKLDIVLDGLYDVEPLCAMLVEALQSIRFQTRQNQPHLRATGLVDAEIVETAGEVKLIERDRSVTTVLPKDAIVTESSTTQLKLPGLLLDSVESSEHQEVAARPLPVAKNES